MNVTVLSQSSPTSSASVSETTWLDDEEFEDDSGEEAGKQNLPDPELFDTMIETTLAWLLAMEEQFANNDLTKHDQSLQLTERFQWSDYCQSDVKKNLHTFTHLTTEERNEVELLTTLSAERLKMLHGKILARVDEAMTHFEVHEDLTAHLSRRQMSVGRCLRLGSRIIQACRDKTQLEQNSTLENGQTLTDLDREDYARVRERLLAMDPEVIQRQTALLATRWNNLCRINQTLGRRITTCLLRRQGMLLIAIRLQLEKLEAEHRLVEWVNTRYAKLQNALLHWRHFEEEASVLSDWLTERAEEVGRISAMANATHAKSIARHASGERELNSTTSSLRSLERLSASKIGGRDPDSERSTPSGDQSVTNESIQRLLEQNEAEMEAVDACLAMHESRWAQLLASLDRRAQALRDSCGDTEEVSRLVESTVDQLVSRWSQLAEPQLSTDAWIDRYTKDIDGYFESNPTEQMEQEPSDNQKEFEHPDNKRAATEQLHTTKASKMPCLDSPPPASPTGEVDAGCTSDDYQLVPSGEAA
ncbi:unnamed protein product [Echinostoma caproni]|uniref:Uncharacterized protein n=1 Tax=Echinostoma caproni TaxID=27848 RepID=A0A3P8GF75_9TREM|nr:unnamed protein product [Echinostoma caproni]